MHTATIYFSDGTSLKISDEDVIIPVSMCNYNDESFCSMGKSIEIYNHEHDGLIPSLTTAFCQCNFFYLNTNGDTIYSSNAIVRIVNN